MRTESIRGSRVHMVYIDRFNSTTHEPLEGLQVIVTYDGDVYKIWRSFPPVNSSVTAG